MIFDKLLYILSNSKYVIINKYLTEKYLDTGILSYQFFFSGIILFILTYLFHTLEYPTIFTIIAGLLYGYGKL